ncbi:immunoglobulin domain-containing protein, partial [Paraclostridium dentum]|uniref:immunoglobulin domain-containing protein n=1 Tax=Paraclostridium dentum TaxID=2662455 RepID=UPI003F3F68AF
SKYEMKSSVSTISLTIKHVDVSDSGQYLCGFYLNGHTILKVVDLNVQGKNEVLSFFSDLLVLISVFLLSVLIYKKKTT